MTQNTAVLLEQALELLRPATAENSKEPDRARAYRMLVPIAMGDSPEVGRAALELARICIYAFYHLPHHVSEKYYIDQAHGSPITRDVVMKWAKIGHEAGNADCTTICGDHANRSGSPDQAYAYYLDAARKGHPQAALKALTIALDAPNPEPETILFLGKKALASTKPNDHRDEAVLYLFSMYLERLGNLVATPDRMRHHFLRAILRSDTPQDSPAEPPLTLEDIGPYPGGSISDAEPAP